MEEFNSQKDLKDPNWYDERLKENLDAIPERRGGAAVISYASAFLKKPVGNVSITREDINRFMNALYGAPTEKYMWAAVIDADDDPEVAKGGGF